MRSHLYKKLISIFVIAGLVNTMVIAHISVSYAQEQRTDPDEPAPSETAKITSEGRGLSTGYFFQGKELKSQEDFEKVLTLQPAALKEYRRSKPFLYIATLGVIGTAVIALKHFSETLSQARDPQFESENEGWADVTILAVTGVVTLVSSLTSSHYFKKSIQIFNEKQERNSRLQRFGSQGDPAFEFNFYARNVDDRMAGSGYSARNIEAGGLLKYHF